MQLMPQIILDVYYTNPNHCIIFMIERKDQLNHDSSQNESKYQI